jgi:hypothetical protein
MKHSCLMFSEGGRDKRFLMSLIDLPNFKYHTNKWSIICDNASGSSPEIILKHCCNSMLGKLYDLVLCFIDLDKLKSDHPKTWKKEKKKLEQKFSKIIIIWQFDSAEDEYRTVLGNYSCGKSRINKIAQQKVKKFINSSFWKRILEPIRSKEKQLSER